jgi:hypothetical protein
VDREAIMEMLFAIVTASGAFATTGRRLKMWTQVADQPALFLRDIGNDYPGRSSGLPAKRTLDAEIWIYARTEDPDTAPVVALNKLLDLVEDNLAPDPWTGVQDLDGLATHCAIEGRIEIDAGDLDGQAKAVIPIRILVP